MIMNTYLKLLLQEIVLVENLKFCKGFVTISSKYHVKQLLESNSSQKLSKLMKEAPELGCKYGTLLGVKDIGL